MNNPTLKIDQPTIFFPGTLCDERLFKTMWQQLDNPMRAFVPLQWAEDMSQMKMLSIDRLAYFEQPAHLVGFSMGGYIAAATALENPSSIASLTLISCAADKLPAEEIEQRKQILKLIENKRYKSMSPNRLASFFGKKNSEKPELLSIIQQMEQDLGTSVLAAQIRATKVRDDLVPRLAKCHFPIHIIVGEEDNLVSPNTIQSMSQRLPKSQIFIIKGAGHMLPIEQPLKLAECLVENLR